MEIRLNKQVFQLELKHAYIPCVIESTCPKCGVKIARDLGEDYLSYPTIGEPTNINFVHEIEEPKYRVCARWDEKVIIEFTVRAA
jgi:hypothetical protein